MSFQLDSAGVLRLEAWRDLPWLLHGFTTRRAGDFRNGTPDAESLRRVGADGVQLKTVRQIHSDRICLLSGNENDWDERRRPEADALATSLAGQVLGVRTADCLPVLLVDRSKRAVAAVHAGWRGTQQQIAARAVEKMRTCFDSEAEDLEAAIGPGIAVCCFEVGSEVAEQFDPSLVLSPAAAAQQAESPREAFGPKLRLHVDLVAANRKQLLEQGIPGDRIWSSDYCTYCRGGDFFSYRRDRDTARMLAFIGIRSTAKRPV